MLHSLLVHMAVSELRKPAALRHNMNTLGRTHFSNSAPFLQRRFAESSSNHAVGGAWACAMARCGATHG